MMLLGTVQTRLEEMLTLGGWLESTTEFWLWSTLLLLIVEMFTAGFFMGALAVSTLLTAGGSALGLGPGWQTAFLGMSAIGSLLWVHPVFKHMLSPQETPTNTGALIGQVGSVVAQVPSGGHGRGRLRNEEWRATSEVALEVGTTVKVQAVEGNTVRVAAN